MSFTIYFITIAKHRKWYKNMQQARIARKLNIFCLFFCRTSNSAVSVTAGCLNKYSTVVLRFKIQK